MSAVIVSLRVKATPQQAFDVFTQDIALWWRPSGLFELTPRGDGALRFEPGEGGRLVTDLSNGKRAPWLGHHPARACRQARLSPGGDADAPQRALARAASRDGCTNRRISLSFAMFPPRPGA